MVKSESMSDTRKKLQDILGLTDTEAAIYVAALSYPSVGISDVVKLTGIKRTTVYHALDTLAYKGLAAQKYTAGRAVFSMIPPHSLRHALAAQKSKIEEQEDELKKIVPELELIRKDQLFSTQVQHFQGVAGVKAVYEELLYCKSHKYDAISPMASFLSQYGEDFHRYVNIKKSERAISSRVLWEQVKVNKPRSAYSKQKRREVRLMPSSMWGRFRAKIFIFDNKVALIMPAHDAGAVLITSEELHAVFQVLFDTIWGISEPVKLHE